MKAYVIKNGEKYYDKSIDCYKKICHATLYCTTGEAVYDLEEGDKIVEVEINEVK